MAQLDFKARLAALKQGGGFEAAKAEAVKPYVAVEDGRYIAALTTCEVGESISSGRLQWVWGWTISEGDMAGKETKDFEGLEDPTRFAYLFRKIALFGIDINALEPEDFVDVAKAILEMKPVARIQLKTNKGKNGGEFQNLTVQKVLELNGEPVG